jgi:hypothetical protein
MCTAMRMRYPIVYTSNKRFEFVGLDLYKFVITGFVGLIKDY